MENPLHRGIIGYNPTTGMVETTIENGDIMAILMWIIDNMTNHKWYGIRKSMELSTQSLFVI